MTVTVRFLGTNGWFTTQTGKTVCILIDSPKAHILLDAGEGIAEFQNYASLKKPTYLFISHHHLDHIYGLHLMGLFGHAAGGNLGGLKIKSLTIGGQPGSREIIKRIFNHPFTASHQELDFPVDFKELPEMKTRDFSHFKITPFLLKHADPNFGYRIELEGKTLFYTGDTAVCEKAVQGARNADLLIHECSFLPGIESKWGHTNPAQAAGIAKKASAKRLALVHFDASHYRTLEMRKEAERRAKLVFPNTVAATDGMAITL